MTLKPAAQSVFFGTAPMAGAVFDFDGTLVDSLGAWRGLEDAVFEASGGACRITDADRAQLVTFTVPETAAYLHRQMGFLGSDAQVEEFMDAYMVNFFSTKATLHAGVREFLDECRAAGVAMTVASSSRPAYLKAGLEAAGIAECFAAYLSVDDVGASKRSPAIYDRAREIMGTPRNRTWVFEDSLYALQTAARAGFKTVALCNGETAHQADAMRAIADVAVGQFADLVE